MNKQPSALGLAIMAFFERLELVAYQDQHQVWTCGYGHTGSEVRQGTTCTPAGALLWLQLDTLVAVNQVNRRLTRDVSAHQFDALVSFTFNAGVGALDESTMLKDTNLGLFQQAADTFLQWDHVGKVVNVGLDRRRTVERALYLDGLVLPA